MYNKKILAAFFFLILSLTGIAEQVIDANFFHLDRIVNNDFIKKQTNDSNAPDYFINFFAIDAAKYTIGNYYYGIGICKGTNCAYYFDMKMRTKFYAINMDTIATQQRALKYVDKTAVTESGRIYIIDAVPNEIYYWEITGSTFKPAGKIDYDFSRLKDIYCDTNEILYILDIGQKRIYKYSTVLNTFLNFELTNAPYISYSDISFSAWGTAKGLVASNGNIYLIFEHSAIIKIDPQGNVKNYFTINRETLGLRPHRDKSLSETWLESIALGPNGNIFVLDINDEKIHIFNENLDYLCSWYDPEHPVSETIFDISNHPVEYTTTDICFPRGMDYLLISYPWGFYSYKLNEKNAAISLDNTYIYPDLVNDQYKGISITVSSLSEITLAASVNIQDKKIKIFDNIIITPDSEFTFAWNGKDKNGKQVPYGNYKLSFYADSELIKEFALSIKQPPVLTIYNIDGEIIDNAKQEIDYSYQVSDPGFLRMSISSPGREWETFIYEGHIDKGHYNRIVSSTLNDKELPDDYYCINFYLMPTELRMYTLDSTRRNRIFVVNKHDLTMGEIINKSTGFNPHNPDMAIQQAGFFLSEGAYISCDILNRTGDIVQTLFTHVYVPGGEQILSWNGINVNSTLVPDGEYSFYVKAEQDYIGTFLEDTGDYFILDTTPAVIDIISGGEIAYISPNESSSAGIKDTFSITFSFNETVDVECNVKNSDGNIVKSFPAYTGLLPSLPGAITWGGESDNPPEPCVADGRYRLEIEYTESFGNRAVKNSIIIVDNNKLEEAPAKEKVFTLNTFPVNTYTDDNQYFPVIAKVEENYVIAWQSERTAGKGYDIYARAYDSNFQPIGGEFRVNTVTEKDQTEPAISAIQSGFVIVWNSYGQDMSEDGIYLQEFNTDFQPVGDETRVNITIIYAQEHPAVAAIDGGYVVVWGSTWHDDPDVDTTITGRVFNYGGIFAAKEFHITETSVGKYAFLPDVVRIAEGFIVTWEEGPGNYDIYARKYDHTGQALGNKFTVFKDENDWSARPSIACLADGFIIVWISENASNLFDTYGQKFDFDCNKIGKVFKINTESNSNRFYPQVNHLNSGCIVSWHSDIPGDDSHAVCAKIIDNDCHSIVDEFQVSEFDINPEIESQFLNTAIETGTGFIISWQSNVNDGYDLFAKNYEVHTVPEGLNLTAEILTPSVDPYSARENFSIQGIASDAYMEQYNLSFIDGKERQLLKSEKGKSIFGEFFFFNILSCEKGKKYSILLEAWDKAGNFREDTLNFKRAPDDDEFIISFTIDKYYHSVEYPPRVSFTLENPSNVTLEIINQNGITEKTFNLGIQPETVKNYILDISSLPDGEYYLHLIVKNSISGRYESKLTFTIDNTKPVVSIRSFGRYFSHQLNVKIPARVIEKNIKTITMACLDEYGVLVETLVETNLEHDLEEVAFDPGSYDEGSYTIVLSAEDLAGNTRSFEYPVFIDRTMPKIQFTLPDFNSVWTKTVVIDALIIDSSEVSKYNISFRTGNDEELLFTGNTSQVHHEWNTAADEPLTVEGIMEFDINDKAGNKTVLEKPVIIDNNPPQIEIMYEPTPVLIDGKKFINGQNIISILADSGDEYSHVENIYYAIKPGSWVEYKEPLMFPDEGLYTIEYYATDNTGNVSAVTSTAFIVDSFAPLYTVTIGEPLYMKGDDAFIPLENNITIEAGDTCGEYRSGLKKIEYKVNDGMWTDYGFDGIQIYSAGPVDIYIKVSDNVDNTVEECIGAFIVDIAPPFTDFSANASFYYSFERNIIALGSAAYISLEAVDLGYEEYCSGIYKTYYTLDNVKNEYAEPFFIPEGVTRDFHFYSIDNVGNMEQREPVKVSVDTLPPDVYLYTENDVFRKESVIYSKSGNMFGFQAFDNFAGLKDIFYKFDDAEYNLYKGTFSLDEMGDVFITYYAEDWLALKSGIATVRIIIDETPPGTTMATNLPLVEIDGRLYADSRFVFSWPAYDTQCGIAETFVTIDNNSLETDPLEYIFTDEGEHIIEYYSRDNLGNTEDKHEVIIITPIPDLTPPVSSIAPSHESYNDGSMDYYKSDIVFTIEAVDLINETESYASGVETIFYALDGGEEIKYEGEDIHLAGQGLHEITFHAVDYSGNSEEKNYYFLTIDDTPPESELFALDSDNIYIDNVLYITGSLNIEIIAHDDYCGVKAVFYRINTEGDWKTYEEPFNLVPGDYEVEYYAMDNLGNTEGKKSISIKVVADYNIISYKTACIQIKSPKIKDYDLFCDVNGTSIGYIKGSRKNSHIFFKNISKHHNSIFYCGKRISLKPGERLEITLSGTHIVTTEIRNNSQDIFIYSTEEKNQEGIRLSFNGRNESPVIIGNKVYWLHNEAGMYNIVEYDTSLSIDTVIFTSHYPVMCLKSSGNAFTFKVSEPYSDIVYGYVNNELKILFEKPVMNDDERIVDYSLNNNLLVIEDMVNGEHTLFIYSFNGENVLIDCFAGKNPLNMDSYLLYTEEKDDCEVLYYYNIINKTKTGIVKGKEIKKLLPVQNGDLIVEREYTPAIDMKPSGNMPDRHHTQCGFIPRFHLPQVLYLKYMEAGEYVRNIRYSTGATSFAYNKYCDYGDFIYADELSTFLYNMPFPLIHQIQTFSNDLGNTDENYLTFLVEKDLMVIVVKEKDKKNNDPDNPGYHDHLPRFSGKGSPRFNRCYPGMSFEYYEIKAGEYFSIDGPGPGILPPLVFILGK